LVHKLFKHRTRLARIYHTAGHGCCAAPGSPGGCAESQVPGNCAHRRTGCTADRRTLGGILGDLRTAVFLGAIIDRQLNAVINIGLGGFFSDML
jgi:hypothetical protein